jgi:TolB-like protein/Tfp pilus assembly protein PilF
MKHFVEELKRRNVLRVAIAYLAVSWLLIQVVETLFPIFGQSDAQIRLVVVLLVIGFPLILLFSWLDELTPEGLKLERDVDPSRSMVHHTGKRLDRGIIIVLTLALGYFAIDKFVLDPARDSARENTAIQRARSEALVESYGENSIAVLPFVNMSDDASNEYFSDGISEELLNLLAKIPQLRVISRTSAFSFKGKEIDIRTVSERLNVAHVLEGSVRRDGNRVRITAQLIDARTDTHLWSETYDRTLEDIFTIQDEIAEEVVGQFKVTLSESLSTAQDLSPEAYALILQVRHLFRLATPEAWEQAIGLLQEAISIDPAYAEAWSSLADIYINQADSGLRDFDEGYELARVAARKALSIDPTHSNAHAGLGWIADSYDGDLAKAARHYERALILNPSDPIMLGAAGGLAKSLGRFDEAVALFEAAVALDPVDPTGHNNLGHALIYAGQIEPAIISLRTTVLLSPDYVGAHYFLGTALIYDGDPDAALESIQQEILEAFRLIGLAVVYHALGRTAESESALAKLIDQYAEDAAYNIAQVFAFRGEPDKAFEWLEKALMFNDPGLSEIVGQPDFSSLQSDARWLPFLRRIGRAPEQLAAIRFEVNLPE